MSLNKVFIVSTVFIVSIFITILILIINNSYAYQYDDLIHNYTLFYKEDKEELTSDIKEYISQIDDILIPNSNFELSNTLK